MRVARAVFVLTGAMLAALAAAGLLMLDRHGVSPAALAFHL